MSLAHARTPHCGFFSQLVAVRIWDIPVLLPEGGILQEVIL
jgi:hypothetical protein